MEYIFERNKISPEYKNFVMLNKSNHSYAINNKITSLFNKTSWLNQRCFIIAGGISLKDFNFNRLNKEKTIGINKVFEYYDTTINYSMDSEFYDKIQQNKYDIYDGINVKEKWLTSKSIKVSCTPMGFKKFGEEVYLVRRNLEKRLNTEDLDKGIYSGKNSATGALMLAIALGANPIYLLGYDFYCNEQTHFHKGYENRNIEQFKRKLEQYKKEIEGFFPLIKKAGITVYNTNINSELKCFPFTDVDKVLEDKNVSKL